MPENGDGDGANVFHAGRVPAVEYGPGLGPQDEVLGCTGPGSPTDLIGDVLGGAGASRSCAPRQPHGKVNHVVGRRHLPYQILKVHNLRSIENGFHLRSIGACGCPHDFLLFLL